MKLHARNRCGRPPSSGAGLISPSLRRYLLTVCRQGLIAPLSGLAEGDEGDTPDNEGGPPASTECRRLVGVDSRRQSHQDGGDASHPGSGSPAREPGAADEAALYAFELFKRGTSGLAYLLKDRVADLDELLRALREVVNGGSVIDPIVVEELMTRPSRTPSVLLDTLTPREKEVIGAMAEGRSNSSIADSLFISGSAVEKHITSIFDKIGLPAGEADTHRRVAAVLAFLQSQEIQR